MQNKLTAPSAKELYFKAILLYLANDDAIGANQAMQKYLNNDPTFLQTRQQKFAQALITSVKEQNLSLFSNEWYSISYHSYKFNEIIPFDKWKTTILTKIKALIPEEGAPQAPTKTVQGEDEIEL
jgi:alpha-soluble NSF attachment protein